MSTYHVTSPTPNYWATKGVDVKFDKEGNAVINVSFDKTEAKIIFFGVEQNRN